MGRQRRRRQPGAGRRRLQGLPGGQVQHGRLGGGGAGPRHRALRAPLHHGHRRQPGHLPHGHHAPAQRRGCQRGHRLHGHLLPPLLSWRIPRRFLPGTVPHHRHLRPRPSHRHGAAGSVHGGSAAAAAAVRTRRAVRAGDGAPDGRPVRVPVPDRAGHGRGQVQRVGLRHGPVRRARRARARRHVPLLQPLPLLHQRRHAPRRHRARLRPGPRRPQLGLRRLRRRHARRHRRLPVRHQAVPLQAARRRLREPRRAHPPGPRRRRPEAEHRRQARAALRGPPRARARPPHGPVPVAGQGGGDGRRRRRRQRPEPVEAVLGFPRGGGEDGGAADAGVGDDDPVLDHLRADDHLLRGAGDHHGPPRGGVPDPGSVAHRLLRRRHHAHARPVRPRRRAALPEPARVRSAPAGAHEPGEDGHRPGPLHRRHGRRRRLREEAPRRRRCRRRRRAARVVAAYQRVHADAAVPAGGRRRGVHLHGAARLLHHAVAQEHEDHEHGPLPHHALARLLPQQRASVSRQALHAMARRHHQPQPPRLLLLAAGRARRRQPRRLPRLCHVGRGTGQHPGGTAAARDARRREMLARSRWTSLLHRSLIINYKVHTCTTSYANQFRGFYSLARAEFLLPSLTSFFFLLIS